MEVVERAYPGRIIRTPREFNQFYAQLGPQDVVVGLLPLRGRAEYKLLDLVERGVRLLPAALAQQLSRSKAAQAEVLGEFMLPGTFVAQTRGDLAAFLSDYHARGVEKIITKRERANCGQGVNLWNSLEDLVSLASVSPVVYPLVVQPFVTDARDVRVVILGDYVEAYERHNPHNFRHNLCQGGQSQPLDLAPEQLAWCQAIMARGKFPYAVLDLLFTPEGRGYLAEINLKAGLKAARLSQEGFRSRVAQMEEDFLRRWQAAREAGG